MNFGCDQALYRLPFDFWDAVTGWQAQTPTRAEAVAPIGARLREWVETFERARAADLIDAFAGAAP